MTDEVTENPAQNVTFASNGNQAHGYLALPERGSGPGLVVIQEWWGLTSHLQDVTNRFAAEGYVALAPDLYGGRTTHDGDEAARFAEELPVEQAARDLSGAVDFLLAHEAVTSSAAGAVGFCMGGGFVLMLAAQHRERVSAAVSFYGVLADPLPDFSAMTARVQGHFGLHDDFTTPADARELSTKIETESEHRPEFHYYDAGHAFFNDENLLGTYDRPSAALAWDRTLQFLQSHLH